jgi:putative thioredoxin
MSFADPTSSLPDDLILDGTDASFMKDVVEASRSQPVLVDFWASWCGPCRQLTPALEKAVRAAKGKVKLVKIDVDANPAYAQQLRVQSIPTVYAFRNGQPVDGFQGAIPDSQLKAFIERLTGEATGPSDVDQLLSLGAESMQLGDLGGAAQAYAQAMQLEPDNPRAIAGMARVYLADGDTEQARQTIAIAPPDSKDPEVLSVRAALALGAAEAPSDTAALEARVSASPDDHQARFDLAEALAAGGQLEGAVDHLLEIVRRDHEWNDQAARKKLLVVFDAAGANSEIARSGRRRLSSILFA